MSKSTILKDFVNLYQLQKTLRFELKPIGKTVEHIESKGFLEKDEARAEEYRAVKSIIDGYHKYFMEKALNDFVISEDSLYEYEKLFLAQKDDAQKDRFKKLQDDMRKQISKAFTSHPAYKTIDKKELIKDILPEFVDSDKDREIVKKFSNFTTYFTGFHENRKNLYVADEKHSAIAYRIVHENLPTFLNNKRTFEKMMDEVVDEAKQSIEPHLLGAVLEDMFKLEYFNHTLSQTHIDLYNTMLGGCTLDDGTKVQGLNEKINLFRQKNDITKRELPNLTPLKKQLLSDRESMSWVSEGFDSEDELNDIVKAFYTETVRDFECCDGKVNLIEAMPQLFCNIDNYDSSLMFVRSGKPLTDISQTLFKDYSVIKAALWEKHLKDNPKKSKSKTIAEDEERFFDKKEQYFSFYEIIEALDDYIQGNEKYKNLDAQHILFEYFKTPPHKAVDIDALFNAWLDDKKSTEKLKSFLDAIIGIAKFYRPLSVKSDTKKDIAFYSLFDIYYENLGSVVQLYNKVRNFKTKKPYSYEKFKLNFENSTLLDGWDVNKEPDNTSILFRRGDNFYLGIMDKKNNKAFKNIPESTSGECYEKIDYKLLPGANKMLPKVFLSKKGIDFFDPPKDILDNYKRETHKKGENFNISDCHKLIDFFKDSIEKHPDWKHYEFNFSDTRNYKDLSEFYKEVEQQGYKIRYRNVDSAYIDSLIDEGKLYFFQIYNKDFSPYSKGTPNMHTIYWRMLFDEANLEDVSYKLNGQAEVFYRKKSIEYDKETLEKGHHYQELKSKFNYPIIKDKRFSVDKFKFHVPITLNFKAEGISNIADKVHESIREYDDIKVIGIDRGERHLLYLSLIDSKGNIIEQYTLNEIVNHHNGKDYHVNYHSLLAQKEKNRDDARKSWTPIETIKELKEGYLSQVVHKISNLIIEHGAIVVMEDLNFGFKRGRFKVEKQVYQKFEKMLIDKLNYLVDKKREPAELGGVLKALQLTNKFQSFEKMGKQNGFLFYVPAWNTSKIDPTTGFVNLFDTKYRNIESAREFFEKFKSISFNDKDGYFEFSFDYDDFTQKAKDTRTKWTLCSYGDRIRTFRNKDKNNQWDSESVNLTKRFERLLPKDNIKEFITKQDEKRFFEDLLYSFKLMLQMRNTITNSEVDYMISPVKNIDGYFYDSRCVGDSLPKDADANGAYNIARKGLLLVSQIKDGAKKLKPITNKEWLQFAQGL